MQRYLRTWASPALMSRRTLTLLHCRSTRCGAWRPTSETATTAHRLEQLFDMIESAHPPANDMRKVREVEFTAEFVCLLSATRSDEPRRTWICTRCTVRCPSAAVASRPDEVKKCATGFINLVWLSPRQPWRNVHRDLRENENL